MPVVANTYGGTAHLSPLLRKARRLGLATPKALLHLAVKRGCDHYTPTDYDGRAVDDPGLVALSDAELGMALISGAQEYDPQWMRCAAQLLSRPGLNTSDLVRLALMERCAPVLRYIGVQAMQWDAGREAFWAEVLAGLPAGMAAPAGVWPHPSRFMTQAGYRRGGGQALPVWLRPRAAAPR